MYSSLLAIRKFSSTNKVFPVEIKSKMTLEQLKSYFNDLLWPTAFGGPLWGQVVSDLIGLKKSTSIEDKIYYIDHIIDLEHNTGNIFDKNAHLHRIISQIISMKSGSNFIKDVIYYVYPEIKDFYKKYFYISRYSAKDNFNDFQRIMNKYDEQDYPNKKKYDLSFTDLCSYYFLESLTGFAYSESKKDPELNKIKSFIYSKIANVFIDYLTTEVYAEQKTTLVPYALPGQAVSPELFSIIKKKDIHPELFTIKTSETIEKPKSIDQAIKNLNSKLSKDIASQYMASIEKEYLININYLVDNGKTEYAFSNEFLKDDLVDLISKFGQETVENIFYKMYNYLESNKLLKKYEDKIDLAYTYNPPEKFLTVSTDDRDFNHVKAVNDILSRRIPLSVFLTFRNIEFSKEELESIVKEVVLNDQVNFNNLSLFFYADYSPNQYNINALKTMFEIIVDKVYQINPENVFKLNIINLNYLGLFPIVGNYVRKYIKYRKSLKQDLRLIDMRDVFTDEQLYKINDFLYNK